MRLSEHLHYSNSEYVFNTYAWYNRAKLTKLSQTKSLRGEFSRGKVYRIVLSSERIRVLDVSSGNRDSLASISGLFVVRRRLFTTMSLAETYVAITWTKVTRSNDRHVLFLATGRAASHGRFDFSTRGRMNCAVSSSFFSPFLST